jgi:hypothetical protein
MHRGSASRQQQAPHAWCDTTPPSGTHLKVPLARPCCTSHRLTARSSPPTSSCASPCITASALTGAVCCFSRPASECVAVSHSRTSPPAAAAGPGRDTPPAASTAALAACWSMAQPPASCAGPATCAAAGEEPPGVGQRQRGDAAGLRVGVRGRDLPEQAAAAACCAVLPAAGRAAAAPDGPVLVARHGGGAARRQHHACGGARARVLAARLQGSRLSEAAAGASAGRDY